MSTCRPPKPQHDGESVITSGKAAIGKRITDWAFIELTDTTAEECLAQTLGFWLLQDENGKRGQIRPQ